jgi:NADP-dependent 3-hydroxy acid dehydrogenase YdfG
MWALITGATSGIGEATANLLAENGYNVIITGRRTDRLKKIQKKINALKVQCEILSFDVSSLKETQKIFKENQVLFKKVDVLVNNAGLAKGMEPLITGKFEDWEQMIDTNIKGLLYMTRLMLPFMIENKSGHIVNLGSVAGRWVYPGGGVYCATKYAVRALSEGLRMDLNGTGIRVTNIEPGRVETEFSIVRMGDVKKAKAVYEGMEPLIAKDIAECIVWSLQRPKHVNIQEMVVYPTDQAAIALFNKK